MSQQPLNSVVAEDVAARRNATAMPAATTGAGAVWLRQLGALLWKDLVIELRTKDAMAAMLVFGIVALTVFNFAFDLRAESVALVTWAWAASSPTSVSVAPWKACYSVPPMAASST
ncbi:MAG: hypothetical protein HY261_00740 [Chloroflexi bacterium]|nr:hypothetical protein [Chloroflexota bacterium]